MKKLIWIVVGLTLIAVLVRSFRTMPVLVDVAEVKRGTLVVTVDDDGRTRVRERYTISAPIAGRLLRTPLDPGDPVRRGETIVAEFVPIAPALLDARTRREAEARIRRAQASLNEAQAREEQASADHTFAQTEIARIRELHAAGIGTQDAVDRAERDERRTFQGLRAAEFGVQVAQYELEVAEASLMDPEHEEDSLPAELNGRSVETPDGRLLYLRSPIDGDVLRVFEESARTLAAGMPILEVGSTGALEIVADFLSQDAVKIRPGMVVLVEGWGGVDESGAERVLRGRVRVVEPGGFTKISALGVEEQRVNVLVDPAGDDADWSGLGDGYHVELRVLLWEQDDVPIVPTGALFRDGDAWAVFAVEGDVATRRAVELGRMNGLEAEVVGGLPDGARVVLYPSELIAEGTPLEVR